MNTHIMNIHCMYIVVVASIAIVIVDQSVAAIAVVAVLAVLVVDQIWL